MEKLLVVSSTFPRFEGDHVPPFIFNLCKELTTDFDVHALAPYSPKAKRRETIEAVTVHRFKYWFDTRNLVADKAILPNIKRSPWLVSQLPSFVLSELYHLHRLISDHDIKKVFAPWILPQGLVAAIYKRVFQQDIEYVTTGLGGDLYAMTSLNFLRRFAVRNAKHYTVLSEDMQRYSAKRNIGSPHFVPMGTDFSQFHPRRADTSIRIKHGVEGPLLLFVGRLSEKKGLPYLIKAMPAILEDYPDAHLIIVGEGEERANIETLIREASLQGSVSLLGGKPHSELPAYFATADVFISPSIITEGGDREGSPLTITEAMACACPVITTKLKTLQTLIDDGDTGLLVEPRSPETIAEKTVYLLDRPELRNTLGVQGREACYETFSLEKIGEIYADLLR